MSRVKCHSVVATWNEGSPRATCFKKIKPPTRLESVPHSLHTTRPDESFPTLAPPGTTELLADHRTGHGVVASYHIASHLLSAVRGLLNLFHSLLPDLALVLDLGSRA